jgi:hypothetical protein
VDWDIAPLTQDSLGFDQSQTTEVTDHLSVASSGDIPGLPSEVIQSGRPVPWPPGPSFTRPRHGSRLPRHGSRLSRHGSRLPRHGSRLPRHGSRLPRHGSRLPRHGSRLSRHGSRLPRHGSRLPRHGSRLSRDVDDGLDALRYAYGGCTPGTTQQHSGIPDFALWGDSGLVAWNSDP